MDDMLSQVEPVIPALRRYARGLLGDAETADDIVQDCLEKVVANWHRRKNENARSWVFAILHNLAVNRIRHERRQAASVPLEQVPVAAVAGSPDQERFVYGQEVMTAIERLAPDHRCVLLLISVEDLSYADAAKVLGVPLGTVMSRLSRAREQLRAVLEGPATGLSEVGSHLRRIK